MVKYLPRWLMEAYIKIWKKFGEREFAKEDVERLIKNKTVAIILSKLRRNGWLEVRIGEEDARKSIYRLKNYSKIFKEIVGGGK